MRILFRAYTTPNDNDYKKKFWFFTLVYQIDRFFAMIEDMQTKIVTNAYFDHQRAAKLSQQELKTFKWPFLVHFCPDRYFLFWGPLLGVAMFKISFVKAESQYC